MINRMDIVPPASMTLATATAGWTYLSVATDIAQLIAAVVAIAVGVLTGWWTWEKIKTARLDREE